MTRFGAGFLGGIIENDAFTKILLPMDGAPGGTTFIDTNRGGSAHAWTAFSTAQISAAGKFAQSLQGSWISTPAHADFNLGTQNWSVDYFVDASVGTGPGLNYVFAGQSNAAGNDYTHSLGVNGSGQIVAQVISTLGTGVLLTCTSNLYAAPGFHHVELTRSGNTIFVFVDGVLEATSAFTGTVRSSTGSYSVGRLGDFSSFAWPGRLDQYRLSVGIARHTANFAPPVSPYN